MTTPTKNLNHVALQLIAAARRVEEAAGYPTRQLITSLPEGVTHQQAIVTAIWLARWLAGRAGLPDVGHDYDDPRWAARTLSEFEAGVHAFPASRVARV